MAARLNGAHQADVRLKIKTSQLINRLQDYALAEPDPKTGVTVEIDAGRIKAIEILLRKALPDLSQVSGAGEEGEHLHKVSADATFADLAARMERIASRAAGGNPGADEVAGDGQT